MRAAAGPRAQGGYSGFGAEPLLAAYRALGPDAVVAVRSSATGEDGADASFAGMNATITNVSGEESLIDAVLRCWMSLFSPRVITYRASRDFTGRARHGSGDPADDQLRKAGVVFTADPSNGAEDRVVIEGAFGLGEVVVSGEVEPDTYIVSKETLEVLMSGSGTSRSRSCAARTATTRLSISTTRRPMPGCWTTPS